MSEPTPTRRLHPRTVAARHVLAALGRPVRRSAGYDADRPGLARRSGDTVEEARHTRTRSPTTASTTSSSTTARSSRRSPTKPILVGHSFGGMIAEKLLGHERSRRAAIAIDAAQIKGVLPLPLSSLRSTLPVFKNPANKHKAVSLTAEQFRYGFGNALTEEESDAALREVGDPGARASRCSRPRPPTSPCTRRPKVDTGNDDRGPLLLVMGGQDHTVPEAITKSTLKQYRALLRRHRPHRVRGPRPLAHHRQRLARGRRRPAWRGWTSRG